MRNISFVVFFPVKIVSPKTIYCFAMAKTEELVEITQNYYDSDDADNFYHTVWGGEDIHVGLYKDDNEPIADASRRTVEEMTARLNITPETKILDIGAGYGGSARYLAKNFGCKVVCLNLSEVENQRNREKNEAQQLDDLIDVVQGNFENLPFEGAQFDLVWSQDAILHSDQKAKVLAEVARVLKSGGDFVFTDPMQADDCPEGVLKPILERIHLQQLGSVKRYRKLAQQVNLREAQVQEMPHQLTRHYTRVLEELEKHQNPKGISKGYITRMENGLKHWVEGGQNNYLNWGILHFRKA